MAGMFSFVWWMYVFFPVVGIVLLIATPIFFFVFWKKLLPRAARIMFWCKRRGMPPLLIVHDSGRGDLTMIREKRGGLCLTPTGKYKLLPRFVSKRSDEEEPSEEEQADLTAINPANAPLDDEIKALYDKYFVDYSNFISKRTMLMGLGLPFFVAYSGKNCLLNPEALALYEAGEMAVEIDGQLKFNPHKVAGKTLKDASFPLMPLDPRVIKTIIRDGFDETQLAAIQTDAELVGALGRGFGRFMPMIMIIAIVVVVLLVLFILPNFMG